MKIVEMELPEKGRHFVIGEVSGHFSALQHMLRQLDFDPSEDRLILNGNFTGYCLSSRDLVAWLDKPWVIPLLGRSEVELFARLEGHKRPSLAGQWLGMLSTREKGKIRNILKDIPLLAQINNKGKTVVVSHGALPAGVNWNNFKSFLLEPDLPLVTALDRFADRQADLQFLGITARPKGHDEPISGLIASLSSFRTEDAADKIGKSGNRYFLKCSAHMDHGAKYKQSCILPYIDIKTLYGSEVSKLWLKDQDTPHDDCQRRNSILRQKYISVR